MTCAACLALALTLCAVGMSSAQDNAPLGNYQHLKKLEPLIGTWTGEFVSPHDWPTAYIKKGDKITLTLTYKWNLNMSVISNNNAMGQPGSDPFWQSTWLIGWDTANKRIVSFSFENTGGHQVVDDWEIQGDKVTAKGEGSDPFGRKTTFTMVISDIKKDSCEWQMIDVTMDGKKQPDFAKVTLNRAQAK
jgi:hypothetical protein